MTPSRASGTPYTYERIVSALRDMAAGLEDGQRLPVTQAELAARFGVTGTTVRRAVAAVTGQGIIETRHGSGMYARKFAPAIRQGSARLSRSRWGAGHAIQDADAQGRAVTVDRLSVTEVTAPAEVSAALGLAPGAAVICRDRRYLMSGRPVQLATAWIDAEIGRGTALAEDSTGPGGTYARLADLGHAPVRFTEDVLARMPSAAESEALNLGPGRPVVMIQRRATAASGLVVEYHQMILDAGSYVLQYDIQA